MRFRLTIKQLKELSNKQLITAILNERAAELNIYAPLYQRIQKSITWLESVKE